MSWSASRPGPGTADPHPGAWPSDAEATSIWPWSAAPRRASRPLALAVARCLSRTGPPVELVTVDSMQVYRGMDIGTAKPTAAEQAEIPHHLIDLVDPGEDFALARYRGRPAEVLAGIEPARPPGPAGRRDRPLLPRRGGRPDASGPVSRGAGRARAEACHRGRCTGD